MCFSKIILIRLWYYNASLSPQYNLIKDRGEAWQESSESNSEKHVSLPLSNIFSLLYDERSKCTYRLRNTCQHNLYYRVMLCSYYFCISKCIKIYFTRSKFLQDPFACQVFIFERYVGEGRKSPPLKSALLKTSKKSFSPHIT